LNKPEVILLTKTDLIDQKKLKARIKLFEKQKKTVFDISILDDGSVKKLSEELVKILKKM
jgi:ethanolamine utilization protein EutP (predicted NTPase)